MKVKQTTLTLLLIFVATLFAHAQKGDYMKILTIKQPYHTYNATKAQEKKKGFQKVNGMKFSADQKFLLISYASDPTSIAIYEVGTWEKKGVYKVMGNGVELNSSYYSEDGKKLYVKYDRFAPKFKVIEFKTNYIRKVKCEKTPRGCYYEEVTQDKKEIYSKNRKFYLTVSKFDASDVDIYIKKMR